MELTRTFHLMSVDPDPARLRRLALLWWPFVAPLGACLFAFLACFHFIAEDAFIYYRVAENIAAGHGYVFNPGGERIETGSGPLWQYLLAGLAALGVPPFAAGKLLGLSFGVFALALVYAGAVKMAAGRVCAVAGALAVALSAPFVWWTNAGLETALYAASVLWLCLVVDTGRPALLLPPALVLALSRPEGPLLAGLLLIAGMLLHGSRWWAYLSSVGGLLVGYGLYSVFRLLYFNDLQISAFYHNVTKPFLGLTEAMGFAEAYRLVYLSPLALFIPWILVRAPRALTPLVPCAIALVLLIWTARPELKPFFRYYAAALPVLMVLAAGLAGKTSGLVPRPAGWAIRGYLVIALLVTIPVWEVAYKRGGKTTENPIFASALWYARHDVGLLENVRDVAAGGYRDGSYVPPQLPGNELHGRRSFFNYQAQVGRILREIAPPGSTVVYDQMGQTPYYAGPKIRFIDSLGLVTKAVGYSKFQHEARKSVLWSGYLDTLQWLTARLGEPLEIIRSDREVLEWIFENQPEMIVINNVTAKNASDEVIGRLASSEELDERYVGCFKYFLISFYLAEGRMIRRPSDRYELPAVAYADLNFSWKSGECFTGNDRRAL